MGRRAAAFGAPKVKFGAAKKPKHGLVPGGDGEQFSGGFLAVFRWFRVVFWWFSVPQPGGEPWSNN